MFFGQVEFTALPVVVDRATAAVVVVFVVVAVRVVGVAGAAERVTGLVAPLLVVGQRVVEV